MAIAKGIILQHVPEAGFLDISHQVQSFDLQHSAYLLASAFPHFPAGTCHVVLTNATNQAHARLLLCVRGGQYLLVPDNGVLTLAFGEEPGPLWECHDFENVAAFAEWMHEVGVALAKIKEAASGKLPFRKATLTTVARRVKPVVLTNALECQVLHIDQYDNVVTNLTREEFEAFAAGRSFRIDFSPREFVSQLCTGYHQVGEGEKLCRFNEAGYFEVCINKGKAASLLGLRRYTEKQIVPTTIKIQFS